MSVADRAQRRLVRPRIGTMGLALAVAAVLVASFGLSRIAGWIPGLVSSVTLALIIMQFGVEMRDLRRAPPAPPAARAQPGAGAMQAFAWVSAALLAVLLLGAAAGSTAFALAYLRRNAGARWRSCVWFALALGACLQILFAVLLQANLHEGWLWQALR